MIEVNAQCQYSPSVNPNYRASACGPTAIEAILRFYTNKTLDINELYTQLHTRPYGLSARKIVKQLPKILGDAWHVEKVSLREALCSIERGEPIAMKFDRYFTPYFYKKAQYHFHWTVLVHYSIEENRLKLFVEDLGTPKRGSRIQKIDYSRNRHALTFIQIRPINGKSFAHDSQ